MRRGGAGPRLVRRLSVCDGEPGLARAGAGLCVVRGLGPGNVQKQVSCLGGEGPPHTPPSPDE